MIYPLGPIIDFFFDYISKRGRSSIPTLEEFRVIDLEFYT